jgi:hypothetical protein
MLDWQNQQLPTCGKLIAIKSKRPCLRYELRPVTSSRQCVLLPLLTHPVLWQAAGQASTYCMQVEGTCSGKYGFVVAVTSIIEISQASAAPKAAMGLLRAMPCQHHVRALLRCPPHLLRRPTPSRSLT